MNRVVTESVGRVLGSSVDRARTVAGGDINEAYAVDLADGRTVFVKMNANADPTMFPTEARGLAWLAEAGVLRVPRVLAVSDAEAGPPFLVLEYLESRSPVADFDVRLGRGLAELHRFGAPTFGLDHDNFIGRLPQPNDSADDWTTFFRERRLRAQLDRAAERGLADAALRRNFDRLFDRLDDLVGLTEPPARLHGDLWGGNLHVDDRGLPCLVDPAVYGGHREVDLAMMRLFGGFGSRVFDAYDEVHPLGAGHEDRVPLYQLYPLLVHVNLFGGGYVGSVKRAVARYV